MDDYDPCDLVYESFKNPALDWTSMQTVLGVLEQLAIAFSPQFITDLYKEHEGATRHLKILYADDDSPLPF